MSYTFRNGGSFFPSFLGILSLSSESFVSCWLLMEVALLLYLPSLRKGGGSGEVVWKFFFIQILSSLLLGFFLAQGGISPPSPLESGMVVGVLLIKMGAFPFHGWGYHVVESLPWGEFFVLSSFMKLPPLFLLFLLGQQSPYSTEIIGLLSSLGILGIMWTSLSGNWLLLSSSNYLIGWTIVAGMQGWSVGWLFFLLYVFHLSVVVLSLESSTSLVYSGSVVSLLSLIGIPPFGVFFGNVTVISSLIESGGSFIPLLLLISSSAAALLYVKSSLFSLLRRKGSNESSLFLLLLVAPFLWGL